MGFLGAAGCSSSNIPIFTRSAELGGSIHEKVGVVPTPPIVTLLANGMLVTPPAAGVVAVAGSDPRIPLNDHEPVKAGL